MFTYYLRIFRNLEPRAHSVVCPAPSTLVFVASSNVFFFFLVFSPIVVMVKAIK